MMKCFIVFSKSAGRQDSLQAVHKMSIPSKKGIIRMLVGIFAILLLGVRMHPCDFLYDKKIWTSPDQRLSVSYNFPTWWAGIFLYPLNMEPCWISVQDNEYQKTLLKFMWIESMPNLSDIIWLDETGDDSRYGPDVSRKPSYRCSFAPCFSIQYQQGQPIDDL